MIFLAIKELIIKIRLSANNIKLLDGLGYFIPREQNKRRELVMCKNVILDVFVFDLPHTSNEKVTRICDNCLKEDENINICVIMRSRKSRLSEFDVCKPCSSLLLKEKIQDNIPIEKTLKYKYPKLSLEWDMAKNKIFTPDNITFGSKKNVWWICDNDPSHSYQMKIFRRTGKAKQGCPKCAFLGKSKGEKRIYDFLIEKQINFNHQHTFEDCKNRILLRFDFAVYDSDKNLKFLIEYDGKQHSSPVNFGGISQERAKENLRQTQLNDLLKNKYCEAIGVALHRISYKEDKYIEEILDNLILKNIFREMICSG